MLTNLPVRLFNRGAEVGKSACFGGRRRETNEGSSQIAEWHPTGVMGVRVPGTSPVGGVG